MVVSKKVVKNNKRAYLIEYWLKIHILIIVADLIQDWLRNWFLMGAHKFVKRTYCW